MNDMEHTNQNNLHVLAPPITQISFTGSTLQQTFTRGPDASSNEGLGIWFDKKTERAWKIVAQNTKFPTVRDDYAKAKDQGLPIGAPITIEEGTVVVTREGGGTRTTQGFVVVAPQFTGQGFHQTHGPRLRAELNRLGITKRSDEFRPLVRACTTARELGLQDCQGFVRRTTTTIREPITFVDIHLTPGRHGSADSLLDDLNRLPN